MTRAADCMDRVDATPKYRPIELKSLIPIINIIMIIHTLLIIFSDIYCI